jgi:hypothetical protein
MLAWPAGAGDLFLSISPGLAGGPPRPADPTLRTIDSADGSTVASVTITLAGEVVSGGNALARNPLTGVLYAMLKVSGKQFPELVTLDETTGVAVRVGSTQDRFAAIAFTADGTLFGVSGDGGIVPEALYTINPANGQTTFQTILGAGSDGETLAFNPDDGLLYHASGSGNQNNNNGESFETINPTNLAVTTVTLSGDDYHELTALTYWNGALLGGDLGNSETDMPDLYQISTAGVVTFIGDMDHVSKGLASVTPAPPNHVPTLSLPAMALLVAALLVIGAVRMRATSA